MTTVAEALQLWYSACARSRCPSRLDPVHVAIAEAAGRVTAESIWALRSSPPFDASAMDGIAVVASDTDGATQLRPIRIPAERYQVVDTGDPLPEAFDAVAMREHVEILEGAALLCSEVSPYENVRSIGEDIVAHDLLLVAGHRMRPADIAACAAAGVDDVLVRRRPVVAILPTGDEVRPAGSKLARGQFHDTNSIMLAAQAREVGCEAVVLPIEPDAPERIGRAAAAAAASCDLLVIIAGASHGRDDYTAQVLKDLGVIAVQGVAVRPGHPVMLGVIGSTPVLGAPGYPVSAALSFEVFAAPLLARLEGSPEPQRHTLEARLAREISSPDDRDEWVRVQLRLVRGEVVTDPLPRGAGALSSLAQADGLLLVPAGVKTCSAGSRVVVQLLREAADLARTLALVGSDDLALDLAASTLHDRDDDVNLVVSAIGSLAGLDALRDRTCHLAGSPLLDPATGQYGPDHLVRLLPGRDLAVVRLARRNQGLIVAPGNPLGLGGIEDLVRGTLRYVNRMRGSSTRTLFDRELTALGIAPRSVRGYGREAPGHLAVAASVAAGRSDCGLGLEAAARAFGLGFVPLHSEPYEIVLDADFLGDPLMSPFLDLLASARFQASVAALGGYETSEMGRRLI